ncbi:hypothetical protein ACS0TY_004050 [Phlomoides rotata]
MEDPLINNHSLIDFSDHTLELQNGGINYSSDDIELIDMSYTSMKDLLLSSPPSAASPTSNSWQEIPIKDPLVQHAAWAYLQPMVEARDEDDRWWRRLERKCCWLFSCFNDVVLVVFNGWFADECCSKLS